MAEPLVSIIDGRSFGPYFFFFCFCHISISLACVCMSAVFLVQDIHHIVKRGVSEYFMGLILVSLVEKAAEHVTAIDEAW